MRLDARKGDMGWTIYDVATCSTPKYVAWVDDELARWGQHDMTDRFVAWIVGEFPVIEHQEKSISIYPDRKLILFNLVADADDTSITEAIAEMTRSHLHATSLSVGNEFGQRVNQINGGLMFGDQGSCAELPNCRFKAKR